MKCKNCKCCVKGFVRSKPDTYFCIGCKEPYKVYPEQECNNSSKLSSQDEKPDFFNELFDNSTFNEQIDSLKDYVSNLQKKNTELTNELKRLKEKNMQLKKEILKILESL